MLADLRDDPERQRDLGHFLRKKGHAQLRSSHLAEARATLTESLEILDSVEGRSGRNALWVLDLLIEIAVTDGDAPAAERLELDRRERRGETG